MNLAAAPNRRGFRWFRMALDTTLWGLAAWSLLACGFAQQPGLFWRAMLASTTGVAIAFAVFSRHSIRLKRTILTASVALAAVIHFSQSPRQDFDWETEHRRHPRITVVQNGGETAYLLDGVRIRDTGSDENVRYAVRTIQEQSVRGVWLGVQHFTVVSPIAHTFLSFELADGNFLAVSVEARRVVGQSYSPLRGMFRSFSLITVFGSESEVTGRAFGENSNERFPLYLYRTVASPDQAQSLFRAVVQRANQLRESPEFYNTFTNNCTTNIVDWSNEVAPNRISAWNPGVLLPGYTGSVAFRQGLLDSGQSFETLRATAQRLGRLGR